jgi:putative addiction module killer protein
VSAIGYSIKEILTTENFDKWLIRLRDGKARIAIQKRLQQLGAGHYGDYKSVSDGVFELRFHLNSGYRIYFTERSGEIIILLVGGDKSSQSRDIKKAIELNKIV